MRVGVDVSCWSNKRGFGRFTRELLKSLLAIDQENEYWFFIDRQTAAGAEFPEKAHVVVINTSISQTLAASASGRRSLKDLWAMTRCVWSYDLDLFFFPAIYSYFPILNRTKIIGTIHDMTPKNIPHEIFPDMKLRFYWSLKERLAAWQSDLILTVSEFSKREIMKYYGLAESRVKTVTEGPNSLFKPLSRDDRLKECLHGFQLDPEDNFLLYVGGISPHKNLQMLIKVYSELTADPSLSRLKLVIVGDYTGDPFHSDYPDLYRLVRELRLNDRVVFTGYVRDEDLVYLYNASSLLVFPSLGEGFGLPAVEAMACGTPVAASQAGSLPEILGDAGKFFNPHKPEQTYDVIKAVLSDRALRALMSQKGLQRVSQFTWHKAAEDLLRIFENLSNT